MINAVIIFARYADSKKAVKNMQGKCFNSGEQLQVVRVKERGSENFGCLTMIIDEGWSKKRKGTKDDDVCF
jgi:hypothetical protein